MVRARQKPPFLMLPIILGGISIWALLIATGTYGSSGGNWAKTTIVIGVVSVFLGGWLIALGRR